MPGSAANPSVSSSTTIGAALSGLLEGRAIAAGAKTVRHSSTSVTITRIRDLSERVMRETSLQELLDSIRFVSALHRSVLWQDSKAATTSGSNCVPQFSARIAIALLCEYAAR